MGGSAPQPQDPGSVASTQQQYNTQAGTASQAGSNINQFNPYGSVQFAQTGTGPGGVPLYSATENLSPDQQQLLNIMTGTQKTAGQQGQNLISNANYGAQSPTDVIGGATSGNTKSLMDSYNQYMQPFWTTQQSQLHTQLANQGLSPSPTATSDPSTWGPYEIAMNQFRQSQGQAEAGAVAQFEPMAYSQAQQNYLMPLNVGLQEFGMSGPTSPNQNFVQTAGLNINPADYTSAVQNYQNAQMAAYTANKAQQNAMISGLFGVAGTAAGGWARGAASDRRLKRNIQRVGKLPNGLNTYTFSYIWDDIPRVGLMADEVEKIHPEAVHEVHGYKTVDYLLAVR